MGENQNGIGPPYTSSTVCYSFCLELVLGSSKALVQFCPVFLMRGPVALVCGVCHSLQNGCCNPPEVGWPALDPATRCLQGCLPRGCNSSPTALPSAEGHVVPGCIPHFLSVHITGKTTQKD